MTSASTALISTVDAAPGDLSQISHQQLTHIEHLLNNRPREILNFHSPHEVFSKLTVDVIAGVALQA